MIRFLTLAGGMARKSLVGVACLAMLAMVTIDGADAQTAAEVNGEWRGESSGNRATIRLCPGGIDIRAVTRNPGQSQAQFFPQIEPYTWESTTPGSQSNIRLQGDLLIVRQPGFYDEFRRVATPELPPCSRR